MNLRREPTYLSTEVWKACLILARWRSDEARHVTADEMADNVLRETIQEKWPALFEFQKRVAKDEGELIKQLGGVK